ncbi:uncharacterized protein LOC131675448 [Phymastichus coffea]|uniref:uncharacterized protein LOC131675448 n=1 Tax=Phymastichus coffea TaxID=108790 RepID=UPI00273BFDB3|nr:uncharacterized protein LOC131675448 [Phymastichus coffea]
MYLIFEVCNVGYSGNILEAGSVIVKLESGNVLITSCYRPQRVNESNNNLNQDEWIDFLDSNLNFDAKYFLIAGDLNAHHPLWGSNTDYPNGNIIVDNLDFDKVVILNDKSLTHFTLNYSGYSESCIDLTFCSPELFAKYNWQVLDDSWNSDHYPISIEFNMKPLYIHRVNYRYNLKKLNWDIFLNKLTYNQSYFNSIAFSNQDVISRYTVFIEFLNEAILDSLPQKQKRHNDSKVSLNVNNGKNKSKCIWWNDSCNKVVRCRKAALKSIKCSFTMQRFIEVKRLDAFSTKTLRDEKQKSFISFCESVNPKTKFQDFCRTTTIYNNSFKEPCDISGNSKTEQHMCSSIQELSSPKKISTNALNNLENLNDSDNKCEEFDLLNSPFSFDELQCVLNNVKAKSGPGLDKISYEIIINLPEFYQRVLLDIYNDIYECQHFPQDWSDYLVIFIPKGNSCKVRPISLASNILKIMPFS